MRDNVNGGDLLASVKDVENDPKLVELLVGAVADEILMLVIRVELEVVSDVNEAAGLELVGLGEGRQG